MHRIADIKPNDMPAPIHIRVIKKWKTYIMDQSKGHTVEQDLCYLFVDTNGDAIEAVAHPKKEVFLDSKMKLGSCYRVNEYLAVKARECMKVVPHSACLWLGNTATFEALDDSNIPTYYFHFATYDMLASRVLYPRPLTDYVGRVEPISDPLKRAGKLVKKVIIQDECIIFSRIPKSETIGQCRPVLPIAEILAKYNEDETQTRFRCKAKVLEITENRKWHYITCPTCKGKVHLQNDDYPRYSCEEDGHVPNPVIMYCVNTIIKDESGNSKAVFFNEAMEQMMEKSCFDLVVKDRYTDSETIPPDMYDIRKKTAILDILMKKNRTMAINKAEVLTTINPITPDPKTSNNKRKMTMTPDIEMAGKRTKK